MTYILRDYQQAAVNAGVGYFNNPAEKRAAIMVEPTGSGKSLIIAGIAKELDAPTIVFQPTKEILEQNFKKLIAYGETPTIYSASLNSKKISDLTLATIGSVVNKAELFANFKYIIIDECHYVNSKQGMYKQFLEMVGEKVLGLTATPYRLVTDGYGGSILKFLTRTRPRVFEKLIHYTQNPDLFAAGYLAKLDYRKFGDFDIHQLRLNTTGADYDEGSIKRYFSRINFSDSLTKSIGMCLAEGRRNILVFTRFIEESERLIDNLGGLGAMVTGKTPKKQREDVLARFKRGDIKIVANVGVLTHGFDFPELETVIIARPTMSLALYYQMIGRGIRIHPQKQSAWIVDLCDNIRRFGKVEELRIAAHKPGLWHLENNERQLTNVYYNDDPVPPAGKVVETMPFGKHKGSNIIEIAAHDRGYLKWILKQDWMNENRFDDLRDSILQAVK